MEKSRAFRWRPWMFAVLFVLNLILLFAGDCLIHFPVRESVYTAPAEALAGADSTILDDQQVLNFRLFTIRTESGETRLLALEQCGPIARCRVLENDAPPSLPWMYFVQGKAFNVMLNLTENGSIQVQEVYEHVRLQTGRSFLAAGALEGAEVLAYWLIKKASKSKKFLHFPENNA